MISIIIPVFNSESTIEILVNNIIKTLGENYKFEIILINDSSKDNTEEKCKKLVEKYTSVVLYSLAKNFGEHNAVMAGLNKCSGDYAIIMDDDLQHSADSLLELLKSVSLPPCALLIFDCVAWNEGQNLTSPSSPGSVFPTNKN